MRDASDWHSRLVKDLRAEGFPGDVMPPAEFCRVELGLYFLATYFPDEPSRRAAAGAVWLRRRRPGD